MQQQCETANPVLGILGDQQNRPEAVFQRIEQLGRQAVDFRGIELRKLGAQDRLHLSHRLCVGGAVVVWNLADTKHSGMI